MLKVVDGCPMAPNFLLRPMGSKNLMRLSLKKGAHGDLSRAACRKFGVFAQSAHGPKTDSSNAFTSCVRFLDLGRCLCAYTPKALGGLRPSYSAHVRFGEHGAPVRFPSAFVMLPAALSG